MSAATASIADVSKTDFTNRDDSRRNSGHPLTQCTPIPLPALGTQKIIQGNGTNVGTVISLQCPAKHKLVGSEVKCVMDTNSTHWVGETYCKPMSPYEDYGFRVAVLASIVSSAIIFFMSVAFITCCLLDCIKEDKRKKQERESDYWQWEEQAQHHESRSRYSRNNNNNNAQEKPLSLWDGGNPALCDNMRPYRCQQQQHAYGPACTFGSTPPLAPLPGHDYDQPLLAQNTESGPPHYPRPPRSPRETTSSGLVQISAVGSGLMLQCGEHQSTLSGGNPSATGESSIRNMNANRNVNLKEFSIRIISV